MPKTTTLTGKYSAAGEGNVYARANVATCKITASDTDGTFEIFDEQCKPGFESRLHMHTKSFQVCYVVDGAGEFLIFRRVAFRLMAPGFVTVLLFSFVNTWNRVMSNDPAVNDEDVG